MGGETMKFSIGRDTICRACKQRRQIMTRESRKKFSHLSKTTYSDRGRYENLYFSHCFFLQCRTVLENMTKCFCSTWSSSKGLQHGMMRGGYLSCCSKHGKCSFTVYYVAVAEHSFFVLTYLLHCVIVWTVYGLFWKSKKNVVFVQGLGFGVLGYCEVLCDFDKWGSELFLVLVLHCGIWCYMVINEVCFIVKPGLLD